MQVTFRGVEYEGRHQPLVSEEVFYRVQDILDGRSVSGERRRTHENYLKGTVSCGRCQFRLILTLAKGSYYYFFCRGRQQGNGCRLPYVAADDVEQEVEKFYERIQLPAETIDRLGERLLADMADLNGAREREAKRLETRLSRLEAAQDRLLEGLYAGLPIERFQKEQVRLAQETVETKGLLRSAQLKFEVLEATIRKALEVAANMSDLYKRSQPGVRRLINQALFENIWVGTGLLRKARVVGATLAEPMMVLAQALPEHVSRDEEKLELAFAGVGSNSDYLVPPEGIQPSRSWVGLRSSSASQAQRKIDAALTNSVESRRLKMDASETDRHRVAWEELG